jgi:hypothetical protein
LLDGGKGLPDIHRPVGLEPGENVIVEYIRYTMTDVVDNKRQIAEGRSA